MYPASSEGVNRETAEEVYFYTAAFYPLDNFSAHTVEVWGKTFPTAEHAYQWKKFVTSQPEIAQNIFFSGSPHLAKAIADANIDRVDQGWYAARVRAMEEVLIAKATQHQDVRDTLQKTGNRTIIENSPIDSFWGIGSYGRGENMLGKIWMKIRDRRTS